MPEWAELWRKTGQRGFLITRYKRLEKRHRHNSCGGAVHVPAHLVLPGFLQAKQLRTLNSLWGRAATGKKRSCVYACRVASVVSNSLRPCRLRPARLLCQGGGLSRQES